MLEHAATIGGLLEKELRPLGEHPLIGDVRFHGLAAAVDFRIRDENDELSTEDPIGLCNRINSELIEDGLITRPVNGSLLIAPPLITTPDQIVEISEMIKSRLERLTI